MSIIAIDPGATNGIALSTPNQTQSWQERWDPEAFWMELQEWSPDAVVYERFLYQRRDKVVLVAVEVIGVIKLYAQVTEVTLYEQTPSQAKNLWTDSKLKKLGVYKSGMPHANDAMRHLLYHLVVTKGDRSWLESLKPGE